MSKSIMQKLDKMLALTDSPPIPLGVSVARHSDRLLAETRLELRKCVAALKVLAEEHYPNGVDHECDFCPPVCACGHWEYPCPTVKDVKEALGVKNDQQTTQGEEK